MTAPRRRRRSRSADAPVRAIGYVRVSTGGQVESGAGLDAQRAALVERADREGWDLEVVADEGLSAKTVDDRPELVAALARLDAGDADVLVAAKLDRVSRSVADFARLLERASTRGWRLVLLDLGVDTSTPAGEFVANTIANSAQYERRLIGQRTREGLAAKRAQGVRLGRPSSLPSDVVARIVREHAAGASLRGLATTLTAEDVPTAQGGVRWYPSTVRAVLHSQQAADLAPTT
ncbi:recombinase family protein [Actinomycetospora flava]|uniref:Recombinase family protein n=1 Tax=Actinomycetospora flava TaxID=3129232 RepID=A0ABU8M0G6_9PSEU